VSEPIRFWKYELTPRARVGLGRGRPRRGALVRVGLGVADVHPWPELGDAPLEAQLENLASGHPTELGKASLRFAILDGQARAKGLSLFEGLTIPASHFLLPDDSLQVPQGFDTVKVKLGRVAASDSQRLSQFEHLRLRIDFNARLDCDAVEMFLRNLSSDTRARIEFVEDPCPYDGARWKRLNDATGCRLALDRGVDEEGVDVHIVKPAVQDAFAVVDSVACAVVTSYLDHPIGQLGAAWVAARLAAAYPSRVSKRCGLLTHTVYENDPFIERMHSAGPVLIPPPGTGVGFDDLIERLPWELLR
jgi:O-succinylbenzoate synthase